MLEFLADNFVSDAGRKTILDSITEMLERGTKIDMAVAFLGNGAIEALRIDGTKPTRIICDVLSGGCNPTELEKFLQAPLNKSIEVRHLSSLHTKIYATPSEVVVGSANASANGLGNEENTGTIEGALLTDSPDILRQVDAWFSDQWKLAEDNILDRNLVERAREAWRRKALTFSPKETVLSILLRDTALFKGRVGIGFIEMEATPLAEQKYREVAASRYSAYELSQYGEDDEPFFQAGESEDNVKLKGGDYYISCYDERAEIWQLLEQPFVQISEDDCIILVSRRKNLAGLKLAIKDQAVFARAIKKYHLRKKNRTGEKDTFAMLDELPDELFEMIKAEAKKIKLTFGKET
jgi:HKD family nuclease